MPRALLVPATATISQQTFFVVVAVLAALALACLLATCWLALTRRGLRRRLTRVATRLDAGPLAGLEAAGGTDAHRAVEGDDPSLEASLEHLERTSERITDAVALATEDARRLHEALDAMPEGVVLCDPDGHVRFRNARAASLIGDRHAEVLAAQALDELIATSTSGASAERTLELYGPPRRTLTVRTAPIDDDQRTLGVLAVIDDVTERRRLAAVRRDFVANVSHELKTPVGALGLLAETLSVETDPAVARPLADRIQTEAFRVSRIIDDLLDLSRIEAQETPPREFIEVNLVMAEAVERVRPAAESRRVSLMMEEPTPPLVVVGERRQLVSALYNLLDNAIKYSEEGSQVTFAGRADGSVVALEIRDEGIGIPVRDLERIFERFYRVDQGRSRQTGGTGLGLAIVRHVAGNHGGRVTVTSREGEGSTFTLALPLAETPTWPTVPGGQVDDQPDANGATPEDPTPAPAAPPSPW